MIFRPFFLLLFLFLSTNGSFASTEQCVDKLQNVIAERGRGFQTRRTLNDYLRGFPNEWEKSLSALTSKDLWLDAGCGEGFAIQQYLNSTSIIDEFLDRVDFEAGNPFFHAIQFYKKIKQKRTNERARVMGITYKRYGYIKPFFDRTEFKNEHPLESLGQIKFQTGKFFEEILPVELGQPKLITDFFGIMAYSHSIDQTLKKYLDILSDDGEIYLYLGSEQSDGWSDLTKITTLANHEINIQKWLMALKGVNVERFVNPLWENAVTLRLTRIAGEMPCVPRLKLERVMDGAIPPVRLFKELDTCI